MFKVDELLKSLTDCLSNFLELLKLKEQRKLVNDECNKLLCEENLKLDCSDNSNSIEDTDKFTSEPYLLLNRFLKVIEDHGVSKNQIPKLIPEKFNINYSDLAEESKLIEKLNPELIDWLCDFFGIQRKWMYRNEGSMYETFSFYKNLWTFHRMVSELKDKYGHVSFFVCKKKGELDKKDNDSYIYVLARVKIFEIDDQSIYKYFIGDSSIHWDYWRCRYYLKLVVKYLDISRRVGARGLSFTREALAEIASCNVIPHNYCKDDPYDWHPEDYTMLESESVCAKDIDEWTSVLDFAKENNYMELLKPVY